MSSSTSARPDVAVVVGGRNGIRRFWRVPTASAVAWTCMVTLAAVRAGSSEERDPYWEARAGLENLHGLPLARPDTWSWAGVGGDWYQNSPGWNDLLGIAWLFGGFWGLFLIGFATIFALFALSYLVARRLGAHPLGALAAVVVSFSFALPMLSARATTAVQVLLVIGLSVPWWWRRRVPRHSALVNAVGLFIFGAVLAALGNWIHLSFIAVAPALAVSWAVYWLFSDWPGDVRSRLHDSKRWALVVGGTVGLALGTLTTPYGVAMAIERSRVTEAACAGRVFEWLSPFSSTVLGNWPLAVQWPSAAAFAILSSALFILWWLRRARSGRLDETFARTSAVAVVALPLALAGMFMLRFLGASFLTFTPVLGMGITLVSRRLKGYADHLSDDSRFKETALRWTQARPWRIVLSIVWILLLSPAVLLGPVHHGVPQELAAVEALPYGCRLFTSASISGPTLLLRPDVTVWSDGRADYFGRQRVIDGGIYYSGRGDTPTPSGATCVILPSIDMRDVTYREAQRLSADPTWHLLGTFDHLAVWTRTS